MTTAPVTTEETVVAPYEASSVLPYNASSLTRVDAALASLEGNGQARVVSTFGELDEDTSLEVFAAVTDQVELSEHLGEEINLVHVVMQAVTMTVPAIKGVEEHTVDIVRTILIDADGTAYGTASEPILKSLETMFALMGKPSTWSKPKSVMVIEKTARLGKFFSLMPFRAPKK